MKNSILFIFSVIAIALLVVSQAAWVQQLVKRDKERFEMELKQTLQNIVAFSLSKEVSGNLNSLDFQMRPANPDEIPPNTVIKGSFDTKEYQSGKNLGNFLVGVFAEDLLNENNIPLEPIDSLFRKEFDHYTEIAAYNMRIQKRDSVMREIRGGEKSVSALNDTTVGVTVKIPMGKTHTYSYTAHVVFKPTVFTQRLRSLAALSAMAVIVISLLVMYQLFRLKQKSEELTAHKKAVTGIVHDLKSPLAYVFTQLDVFEHGETNVENKKRFRISKTRVKYLTDKIDLLLSSIKNKDSHSLPLQAADYSFTKRCYEIMDELRIIYRHKQIEFSVKPSEEITIKADPVFFDCCVRNLLDNAVKYSGNAPIVKVGVEKKENQLRLSFADNGIGIEPENKKKVFREFYRADKASSVKNHGIGLAFTKQIVRAHSGKILLNSNVGKGSTFTIVLPQ